VVITSARLDGTLVLPSRTSGPASACTLGVATKSLGDHRLASLLNISHDRFFFGEKIAIACFRATQPEERTTSSAKPLSFVY
jgi:hypothetical protein